MIYNRNLLDNEDDETGYSLGDELRGARVALGKTLDDVYNELKIKAIFIDALECGNFDEVPDVAYVTGYIRSYARYLELDPNETVKRFSKETGIGMKDIGLISVNATGYNERHSIGNSPMSEPDFWKADIRKRESMLRLKSTSKIILITILVVALSAFAFFSMTKVIGNFWGSGLL